MRLLRTMNTADAGDSDECLLDNWPKGQAARAIDLDLDMPTTVGQVGGHTFTADDLRELLAYFLGVFSLSYGEQAQHKPYVGIDGAKLRRFARIMQEAEVWNDFVGVAKAAAAHVLHARVRIYVNRKMARGIKRVIGSTQGRTIKMELREGSVFPAQGAALLSRTVGVNAVCRVIPVLAKGSDQFTHFPFYREVPKSELEVEFPDGKPIAIWDDNAAADATAINKFTHRIGDLQLHHQLEPEYVTRDFREQLDAGGSDFTDEVTPFYVADPFEDEKKLPTGKSNVQLVTQDVVTILGRWFGFPAISDTEATNIVAEAAAARNETVTAHVPNIPADPEDNGHVATAPIEFLGAADGRANVTSGLRADRGGNVGVFVPEHVQAMSRNSGSPLMTKRVEKLAGLGVPGTHGANGRSLGNTVRTRVRGLFGSAK